MKLKFNKATTDECFNFHYKIHEKFKFCLFTVYGKIVFFRQDRFHLNMF